MPGAKTGAQRPKRDRSTDTKEQTGDAEKRAEFQSKKARIAMRRLKKRGK